MRQDWAVDVIGTLTIDDKTMTFVYERDER